MNGKQIVRVTKQNAHDIHRKWGRVTHVVCGDEVHDKCYVGHYNMNNHEVILLIDGMSISKIGKTVREAYRMAYRAYREVAS